MLPSCQKNIGKIISDNKEYPTNTGILLDDRYGTFIANFNLVLPAFPPKYCYHLILTTLVGLYQVLLVGTKRRTQLKHLEECIDQISK